MHRFQTVLSISTCAATYRYQIIAADGTVTEAIRTVNIINPCGETRTGSFGVLTPSKNQNMYNPWTSTVEMLPDGVTPDAAKNTAYEVGRCRLKLVETSVESTWFQRLKLARIW
jgi:hypothetical protein